MSRWSTRVMLDDLIEDLSARPYVPGPLPGIVMRAVSWALVLLWWLFLALLMTEF